MALRLYNTRTRSLEEFRPLDSRSVRIYVCGLTPSAEAHLGHARSFLFFDVLRRYLKRRGYAVTYVQNVTDIDDRSIRRAQETGEHWRDIVAGYFGSFKESMRLLGVREADGEPFATQFIPQIIEMIAGLVERGHGYVAEDGVYYRVSSFPSYGRLANRNVEELEAGARIEIGEHKDDPLDFALWKFAKPGEPFWPSPWGDGRPGWHIECSAMSRELVDPDGTGFDIHGGGADLIFPHHENEIAQSEPLMRHPPMANFWVHGGLLLFDSRKMSKSIGNFEPLDQLLARHDPQAIRLLFLQTGYRKVMNFTEESIAGATVALERIKAGWRAALSEPAGSGDAVIARVEAALDDDFNTSEALAQIFSAIASPARPSRRALSIVLDILGLTPGAAWELEAARTLPGDFIERLTGELAEISFNGQEPAGAIAKIIELRAHARAERDWQQSDRLRDALLRCGVALKDGKDGTTWSVVE